MAEIDDAAEWRRLQETYSEMPDEEVEAVAEQGYQLTDIARRVLTSEISRRGLKVIVRLEPPAEEEETPEEEDGDFDPAELDLRAGWTVENREQALWVKNTLNDCGIPCYFGPDLVENIDKVQFSQRSLCAVSVLKHDYDRTIFALREFGKKFRSDVPEELPDSDIRCPKCGSEEIVLQGLESDTAQGGKEAAQFHWTCDACGQEWHDDGIERE